jgi:hypothetical protein
MALFTRFSQSTMNDMVPKRGKPLRNTALCPFFGFLALYVQKGLSKSQLIGKGFDILKLYYIELW